MSTRGLVAGTAHPVLLPEWLPLGARREDAVRRRAQHVPYEIGPWGSRRRVLAVTISITGLLRKPPGPPTAAHRGDPAV